LLACTDEPNISIPQLANLLIDRSQHTSWTVVFKSLITIHHLLNYGNERFTQYMATSNHSFELNDFMDRVTPQGYGMSTFVRRYAKYINNKISSYRALAIDLCKVKPGKDNGLRTMNMDNLSKTLPIVHNQFDSLLDFGVEAKDLNNGIIMAAFRLLYKDLNRIFAAYQEAIINLVERYFKLSRKKTREALNMYKKYLDRMDKVSNFYKIVEQVGLDKCEMPDTSKLTSLLSVLEEHMNQLEAKKRGTNVASPDVDDDGDDPVTPKKADQDVSAKSEQSKQEPAESGAVGEKKVADESSAAGASSTSNEPPKKAPPPARPSPIKLPKAAPQSEPKPAPPASTTQKAPPERPAKPPSRPPPPSGTPQAPPSAAPPPTSTTSREPHDSGSEKPSDDKKGVQTTDTDASGIQPSSEPPPTCSSRPDETSQEAQVITEQSTTEQSSDEPQANGSNAQAESRGNPEDNSDGGSRQHDSASGHDNEDTTTLPACSNAVNETVEQEAPVEQVEGEGQGVAASTNHVSTNNVTNHDHAIPNDEIEPPPPPPPIED
jgi:hypothetical protein